MASLIIEYLNPQQYDTDKAAAVRSLLNHVFQLLVKHSAPGTIAILKEHVVGGLPLDV